MSVRSSSSPGPLLASVLSSRRASSRVESLIDFVESLPTSGCGAENGDDEEKKGGASSRASAPRIGDRFYLTTAINYTNGKPHIGHAYEGVTSDIVVRYHRRFGRDVFFLTGTDEHGQKIAQTAEKQGLTPRALCDKNVELFKKLDADLGVSYDRFIRTTEQVHYANSQEMFRRALANGDIYLSKYEGWYNPREEQFITDHEAKQTDYKDPKSGKPYERQSEESYFFRMSKYQDRLVAHIKSHPHCIRPESAYNNILSRLEDPLRDLCVSRSTLEWGIPLPPDVTSDTKKPHVLYVWFDALTNYLSGVDYFQREGTTLGQRFWPADAHVIGRDIVWFHTVIWPCMLMSCGVPLARSVVCHGFVTDKHGEKMSKSLGNVVDPFELLTRHSADSVRYFIATQGRFGEDMRWNEANLKERHQSHLTHCFGNLVNRGLVLCKKFCKGKVPDVEPEIVFDINALREEVETHFAEYALQDAAEAVMQRLRDVNEWLTKVEPWKEKDVAKRTIVLRTLLECVYTLSHFMEPFTPRACGEVFRDLNTDPVPIPELNPVANLKSGTKVKVGPLLFRQFETRHEKKQAEADKPVIARVDFRVGKILSVKKHPGADNCYVEEIDIGEAKPRQVVSGLVPFLAAEELKDRLVVIFANLKAANFRNVLSQGMLLAATSSDGKQVVPLSPPHGSKPGDRLHLEKTRLDAWKADEQVKVKSKKKNSFWETQVSPVLRTNAQGDMTWEGQTFVVNGGKVTCALSDAQIS